MITSAMCLKRYGDPYKHNNMVLFDVPTELEIGAIPNKIYMNKDMVKPFTAALNLIKEQELGSLIKTWDGCFNIRTKRGAKSLSLHSFGIAFDMNAAWNAFGKTPTMDKRLVNCFLEAGFDWGGTWSKPDGQHFQINKFPS